MATKKRRTELDLDHTLTAGAAGRAPETSKESGAAAPPPPASEGEEPTERVPLWSRIPPKLLIIGGGLLVILLVLGAAAFFLIKALSQPAKVEPAKVEPAKVEPAKTESGQAAKPTPILLPIDQIITYTMAPFLLDVGEPGGENRFLSVSLTLALSKEEVQKELERNLILIRENMILYFQTKTEDDFRNPEKKKATLEEIKTVIDRSLQSGIINEVYITDLITR